MSIGSVIRWLSSYKRPLFACLIVVLTLGSVGIYSYFVKTLPPLPRADTLLEVAEGKFDVEITLTFDAKADETFVLKPTSVLVKLEQAELLNSSQSFTAGHPVVVKNVPDVKVGTNEFYVEVYTGDARREPSDTFSIGSNEPAVEEAQEVARAVRVRIRRDGIPIAEQTLWSEPGWPVKGKVSVVVPADPRPEHAH